MLFSGTFMPSQLLFRKVLLPKKGISIQLILWQLSERRMLITLWVSQTIARSVNGNMVNLTIHELISQCLKDQTLHRLTTNTMRQWCGLIPWNFQKLNLIDSLLEQTITISIKQICTCRVLKMHANGKLTKVIRHLLPKSQCILANQWPKAKVWLATFHKTCLS